MAISPSGKAHTHSIFGREVKASAAHIQNNNVKTASTLDMLHAVFSRLLIFLRFLTIRFSWCY